MASSRAAACKDEEDESRSSERRGSGKRVELPSSLHKASTHIRYATRTGGGVVLPVRDS